MRAELAAVLDGRPPAVADLLRLRYTRMVLDEALRLYPPAWALTRSPSADDEVGGYRIPRGATVIASPYVTHRHPAFWENPEGFDPVRFAPESTESRHRYAYRPFGGGPRQCIGNAFALMEAQLVLATLAQRYRLDLVPGYAATPRPQITLRPRGGRPMILRAA
jgi:cytochrome P450